MDSNKFPERLRRLRVELDLTQDELGKKLGYGRTTISAYESGRNEPSYDDLKKLSDLFCVSVDYLVGTTTIKRGRILHFCNKA
jgi:transcriptional regulator with XRE-family HTH domain